MKIRPAVQTDIPFILYANTEIDKENKVEKPSVLPGNIAQDLFGAAPKAFAIIAETDEQTVGAALFSHLYFASNGQVAWISNLYVDERYRHQNIARNMIRYIQNDQNMLVCWATYEHNDVMFKFADKIGARHFDGIHMFGLLNHDR